VSEILVPKHPAVFPDGVIELAREAVDIPDRGYPICVLDPFAGVGGVHALARPPWVQTRGVELMPRWAAAHLDTLVGDATHLPEAWTGVFDAVVTSPCYGNRMADHHNATDKCSRCDGIGEVTDIARGDRMEYHLVPCPKCKGSGLSHRRSYKHYYGDGFFTDAPLQSNAGAMAFGDEYKELHRAAWAEVERVLRPGGRFVLNVKDHIRNGKRVRVAAWHRRTVLALAFDELWRWDIPLDGYGYGANRGARVPTEQVYVFERRG
jgi:tRNA G10  N-methylase Trm11